MIARLKLKSAAPRHAPSTADRDEIRSRRLRTVFLSRLPPPRSQRDRVERFCLPTDKKGFPLRRGRSDEPALAEIVKRGAGSAQPNQATFCSRSQGPSGEIETLAAKHQQKKIGLCPARTEVSYYIGRETVIPNEHIPGMWVWREALYAAQMLNAPRLFLDTRGAGRRNRDRNRNMSGW
jgi:hypothetical protein